jgi:L-lactate dehydrogenase complex protein LldF
VLLDNCRTNVLADEVGRSALHCIRCSACLNVCPVYERVGGQAYESVYPGPIGAILTPQLRGLDAAPTLPWASSLCGACYEVCPVKIDIPSILVHLRGRVVREQKSSLSPEALAMKGIATAFGSRRRYEAAQRLARLGRGPLAKAALPGWTAMRELPEPPKETFREWWKRRQG